MPPRNGCYHHHDIDRGRVGKCRYCKEVVQFPWKDRDELIVLVLGDPAKANTVKPEWYCEEEKVTKATDMSRAQIVKKHEEYEGRKVEIISAYKDLGCLKKAAAFLKMPESSLYSRLKKWGTITPVPRGKKGAKAAVEKKPDEKVKKPDFVGFLPVAKVIFSAEFELHDDVIVVKSGENLFRFKNFASLADSIVFEAKGIYHIQIVQPLTVQKAGSAEGVM